MVPPLLKLSFIQGPIEGESREYKPGSTIRIGRVVRGNEITIKDGGISTKHLKIISDSENWIIQDLGSSNGTTVNLEDLDPDTPLILSDGDVIRLGGDTIIEVYFVADVKPPESSKLPPRPRRNNRRLAVADPDPDLVEPVQEVPKRTRAVTKSKDVADEDKEPKVVARVGRPRKVAVTKEDEAPVEKKVNARGRRGKKNTESDENENHIELVQEVPKSTRACRGRIIEDVAEEEKESEVVTRARRCRKNEKKVVTAKVEEPLVKNTENLGLKSVKLEIENTPMGEVPPVKRATRGKKIGNAGLRLENVKCEDIVLEEKDEQRVARATRSKRKEIYGDSFLQLDMVLNQARKSRAKKKKEEQKPPESVVVETRNDEDVEDEKEDEDQIGCSGQSDEEDEISKNVEQVETELEKKEDGETEKVQETSLVKEECGEVEREEAGSDTSENVEQKPSESIEMEGGDDDAEEDMANEKDNEGCSERNDEKYDKEDEISRRVEQVETELEKSSTLGEDGETATLQDVALLQEECLDSERGCKSDEKLSEGINMEARNDDDVEDDQEKQNQKGCSERSADKSDKEDQISERVEQLEIELRTSSVGEDEETEKLRDTGVIEEECLDLEKDCKSEKKLSEKAEVETRIDENVEEDQKGCSERNDDQCEENEIPNSLEQVETEFKESSLGEDGENVHEEECPDSGKDCKSEEKLPESVEVEARNDDDAQEDKENEGCSERSDDKRDKEDEISERDEQVEIELKKSTIGEDGETEKLLVMAIVEDEYHDSERGCKSEEAVRETPEKVEQERNNKNIDNVKVDLEKLTLGEWFCHLEVYFPRQITKETEEMIEPMRSKALRVKQHIAEQKQAMGKTLVS